MNKPKLIKDFLKLDEELQEQVLSKYPEGYQSHLILFTDRDGKYAHALPYETEDRYYLLRMPPVKTPRTSKESTTDDDEDTDENVEGYTDLDTMQIGGKKNNDDDEEYD